MPRHNAGMSRFLRTGDMAASRSYGFAVIALRAMRDVPTSVSFMHLRKLVGRALSRVAQRPVEGRLALYNGCPTSYFAHQNDTGDTMLAAPLNQSPPRTPTLVSVADSAV